jgi:hypothetical protein
VWLSAGAQYIEALVRLVAYPVPDEELGHEAAHGAKQGPPAVDDLSLQGGDRQDRGQGRELLRTFKTALCVVQMSNK